MRINEMKQANKQCPVNENKRGIIKTNQQADFNTAESQCKRLIKRLRKGASTTVELRHQEDILGVGPRIYDLRHKHGYNIQTFWSIDHNPGGGKHRVARYVLQPGKWKGEHNYE
jgi:hypothetical protein